MIGNQTYRAPEVSSLPPNDTSTFVSSGVKVCRESEKILKKAVCTSLDALPLSGPDQ